MGDQTIWRDGIEYAEFFGNEFEFSAKLREIGWEGVYQQNGSINLYKIGRVGKTPARVIGMTVFWGNRAECKHRHFVVV